MTPLARIRSIKLKLSIVIVAAVGVTAVVGVLGARAGWPPLVSGAVAVVIALALVQVLARGLTVPLRAMAAAARAMAGGEHGRQVSVSSRDEVGELAVAFNRMSAELAEVDRMRRDLVANASHELRTPIAALQATLENMADGVQPPDRDALRGALEQVERLGRLVTQLLDLSRLEAGAVALERREFAVRPLLDRVAAEARLRSDGIPIDVRAAGGLVARGDSERMHQVLANLVDNALRHSPAGASVVVEAARGDDGRVRIEVCDSGPGIPVAERERVFERFYRTDAARSGDGGAGLGLAIVRWIIRLHGGEVRAERGDPAGCRMVVTLPGALEPR